MGYWPCNWQWSGALSCGVAIGDVVYSLAFIILLHLAVHLEIAILALILSGSIGEASLVDKQVENPAGCNLVCNNREPISLSRFEKR